MAEAKSQLGARDSSSSESDDSGADDEQVTLLPSARNINSSYSSEPVDRWDSVDCQLLEDRGYTMYFDRD